MKKCRIIKKIFSITSLTIIIILSSLNYTIIAEKRTINIVSGKPYSAITVLSLNQSTADYKPNVVIALIDTAIDVYHEIYRRESMITHPSTYIEGFPENAKAVNVTFDDSAGYWSNVNTDKSIWQNLTPRTLYWFPHTNIIGISFQDFDEGGENYTLLSGHWHGTVTSSIVAMKCPKATIVMIQANSSTLAEAFSWAVNQTWIDIIIPEFATRQADARPEWTEIPNISKKAVEEGKMIITPSGNRARDISFSSNICGMPWVISVGGVESYSHGASIFVSRWTDYVSNFTEMAANVPKPPNYWNLFNDTYRNGSGTSASAPVVAATFGLIILQIREKFNYTHGIINESLIDIPEKSIRITNIDLRETVNHTAIYWKTKDWQPGHWPYWKDPMWQNLLSHILLWPITFSALFLLRFFTMTRPVSPVAPWLQMGWGFVDSSIVNETVSVLLGEKEMPEKPDGAIRYMNLLYNIRKDIWTN